jgi:hypothetical protein
MVNIKQKSIEIKTLLEIYQETKGLTLEEQTKRTELRQKIDNLDLNEVENLADLILQEKSNLLAEKIRLKKRSKKLKKSQIKN